MPAPDGYPNKSYLGDGAYVQQGSFLGEVVLTTEDGISVQNRVVLAETEIANLLQWLVRTGYSADKLRGVIGAD